MNSDNYRLWPHAEELCAESKKSNAGKSARKEFATEGVVKI